MTRADAMQFCRRHMITFTFGCHLCTRDFLALLGANDLVAVRPSGIADDRDLPLPVGPTCEAMNHNSVGSEVTCERPARHEGDCDDGTGLMWDHEPDCGCHDD